MNSYNDYHLYMYTNVCVEINWKKLLNIVQKRNIASNGYSFPNIIATLLDSIRSKITDFLLNIIL